MIPRPPRSTLFPYPPLFRSYRMRVGGRVKHVRTVLDAVRDSQGRPIRVYGIMQDVTARETSRAKLAEVERELHEQRRDRKSTRLNSSHANISYAVFCLKIKN